MGGPAVVSVAPVPLAGRFVGRSLGTRPGSGRRGQGERGPERGFEFPGPGPGLRYFDLPLALAADDPHGGVQDPVAQRLGFSVSAPRSSFAGFRFPRDVILVAVRWYPRYSLSYRDVEELGRTWHRG